VRRIDATHYLFGINLLRDKISSSSGYPFSLPVVKSLDSLAFHPAVTFFIGENGTGKSTLLEAIATAWGFNPEGGSKDFNFATRASHSELYNFIHLDRTINRAKDGFFLRAESFFNVATQVETLGVSRSYGERSLHEQSHGESFLALFMNRFRGQGLYILDEPEAALSPSRQMAVVSRIHDLVAQNSQFIIATHSPIIMSYPNALIYQLTEDGVCEIKYTDTEYYSVTKEFLNNHEKMLNILMED